VQRLIEEYDQLGALSSEFEHSFARVLLWLHERCGMSEQGVRIICNTVLKYCQRTSFSKIQDTLKKLPPRDHVLFKHYLQQDQRANLLRFVRLDAATSIYTLRAVQKKARVYTNVCCANDQDYPRFALCDHPRVYTLCRSKCCDRLTSFTLGESYGNQRVTDGTELEHLLDPSRVEINCDMHHGRGEACGGIVPGTIIYRHPYHVLRCCMMSEKQIKNRNKKQQ
jgi:hypothetical protein